MLNTHYNYSYCGRCKLIFLKSDQNNSSTISTYQNKTIDNVLLYGRLLYKDGNWNTLCLPYALNNK